MLGGHVPEDYPLYQAARWLGVPVWELEARPSRYRDRAIVFANAEALVQEHLAKRRKN